MSTFTTSRGTRIQHVEAARAVGLPRKRRDYNAPIQPMDSPYHRPTRTEIAVMALVAAFVGAMLASGGF